MGQIRVRYNGPVPLVHVFGSMLRDEGFEDIQYEGRLQESRGAEQVFEQILVLVGVPILSNAAYDLAKAGVRKVITRFKEKRPNLDIEIEEDDSDSDRD